MRKALFGARDQAASNSAATLGRLCDAVPAVSAALVDGEGETVDYSGSLRPTKFAWLLPKGSWSLRTWRQARKMGTIEEVVVRVRRATYAAFLLSEGYVPVTVLTPRAFDVSRRAVIEANREICTEAALAVPKRYFGEYWFRSDVRESRSDLRPKAIWMDQAYCPTTIIGRMKPA